MINHVEDAIRRSQLKVTRRFFVLATAFSVASSLAVVVFMALNAKDVAVALTKSYRNQLLVGQYREPLQGLGANVPATFSSVTYYDREGRLVFSIPGGGGEGDGWGNYQFDQEIYSSETDPSAAGKLTYGVSIFQTLMWCLLFYVVAVMVGYPVLRRLLRQSREQTLAAIEAQRRDEISALARQIAHDIRSPLSAIAAAAHAVRGTNTKAASMMIAASDRIQKMATHLLDSTRGGVGLATATNSVPSGTVTGAEVLVVITQVTEEFRIANGVNIRVTAPSKIDGSFRADANELGRVLSNLLTNAAEATRLVSREPEIKVNVETSVDLALIVKDNGPGIQPEQIDQILSGLSLGKVSGNGLGLSHAKRCVEAWGGSIAIESTPDAGAEIILRIPKL